MAWCWCGRNVAGINQHGLRLQTTSFDEQVNVQAADQRLRRRGAGA
jgi:hypothetical protein